MKKLMLTGITICCLMSCKESPQKEQAGNEDTSKNVAAEQSVNAVNNSVKTFAFIPKNRAYDCFNDESVCGKAECRNKIRIYHTTSQEKFNFLISGNEGNYKEIKVSSIHDSLLALDCKAYKVCLRDNAGKPDFSTVEMDQMSANEVYYSLTLFQAIVTMTPTPDKIVFYPGTRIQENVPDFPFKVITGSSVQYYDLSESIP